MSGLYYDQNTSFWKTVQTSLIEEENASSAKLPRWGTIVNGNVLARPRSVQKYTGTGCLLSAPLKTDGTDYFVDRAKLAIYIQSRAQKKISHHCLLVGFSRYATMIVALELMGFQHYHPNTSQGTHHPKE